MENCSYFQHFRGESCPCGFCLEFVCTKGLLQLTGIPICSHKVHLGKQDPGGDAAKEKKESSWIVREGHADTLRVSIYVPIGRQNLIPSNACRTSNKNRNVTSVTVLPFHDPLLRHAMQFRLKQRSERGRTNRSTTGRLVKRLSKR